ncbi:hypothetical protein NC652_028918 [Populus alba x Populus x berolinensis]|nr:hypothetical protein NC652_028918 [Populus alba x Populus x berolinensis]
MAPEILIVTVSSLTKIAVDSCLQMTSSCKKLFLTWRPKFHRRWRPSSEQSISYHRDDFDDDVEDLPSLPSDISLFFMDSTCGWLFPSLEALDENLSFCTKISGKKRWDVGVEVGPKDDLVQLLLANWTMIYFNCPLEVEHPLFDLSPPWKAEMKLDCLSKFQHGTWGAFGTCQN